MASKARKTGWDAAVAESEAQGGGELAARPGAGEGRQAWPGDVLGCLEVVDRRLVLFTPTDTGWHVWTPAPKCSEFCGPGCTHGRQLASQDGDRATYVMRRRVPSYAGTVRLVGMGEHFG